MPPPPRSPRTRLKPEERIRQILQASAEIVIEQGVFPIALDVLSQRVGVTKGLIYSYFPTQYDLANRLLREHLPVLAGAELAGAADSTSLDLAAARCGRIYFDHVAERGPLLHILLSDPYLAGRLDPDLLSTYRKVMGRLARRLKAAGDLSSTQSVAALNMLVAIPEEIGNLVYLKRLDLELGREIAQEMVIGGVEGLKAVQAPAQP